MSAIWRSAIEWHARTLGMTELMVLSLVADQANDAGRATIDVWATAWKARCSAITVNKALANLLRSGHLSRCRPGLQLNSAPLECLRDCPCPKIAPGTVVGTSPSPPQTPAPEVSPQVQPVALTTTEKDWPALSIAFQVQWRVAYKTEPHPGLFKATCLGLVRTVPPDEHHKIILAWANYLTATPDPRYLNFVKFESAWRTYLTPIKKGSASADANMADFAAVFGTDPNDY